jgi:hypothetical protein
LGEVFEEQEGVRPDVAFGVELGGLRDTFEAAGLGEELGEEAGGVEELEGLAGAAFGEHFGDLGLDALGADLVDGGGELLDGGEGVGVEGEVEAGGEAEGSEHAELVFGEAEDGVSDGAEGAAGEVVSATDEVEGGGAGVAGLVVEEGVEEHAVEGEVAAEDVFGGGGGEADLVGSAAVGVGTVVAEGGDLGGVGVVSDEEDAEVGADGEGVGEEGEDLFRGGGGGDVEVPGGEAEQEVADAASGEECLVAGLEEGAGDVEGGLVGGGLEWFRHVPPPTP